MKNPHTVSSHLKVTTLHSTWLGRMNSSQSIFREQTLKEQDRIGKKKTCLRSQIYLKLTQSKMMMIVENDP